MENLPGVVHAVAIIVKLAIGKAMVVGARVVVGVAVRIGVERMRIGPGEILGPVVEAVVVVVAVGAVDPGGAVGIQTVGDLPVVGHAVAVRIDGDLVPAGALAVPHRDVHVGHGVQERHHVGVDRDALVDAVRVENAGEVPRTHLVLAGHAGAVGVAVGIHRVDETGRLDQRWVRDLRSGFGFLIGNGLVLVGNIADHGRAGHDVGIELRAPVGREPVAVAGQIPCLFVEDGHQLLDAARRALRQMGDDVLDERDVGVVR